MRSPAWAAPSRRPTTPDPRRRTGSPPDAPWPGTRGSILAVIIAIALLVPTVFDIPARFRAVDMSAQQGAAQWADHVLGVMQPDGVILSWWSYSTPLWYEHLVEGKRPDIEIIDDRTRLDLNLGGLTDAVDLYLAQGRPVYVIRLDRREVALLAQRYDLEYIDGVDASSLTRVIGLKTATS